jgi:hypothetical protein
VEPTGIRLAGQSPIWTSYSLSDYSIAADGRTIYILENDGAARTVSVSARDNATGRTRSLASGLPVQNGAAHYIRAPGASDRLFAGMSQANWCTPGKLVSMPATGGATDVLAGDVDGAAFAVSNDGKLVSFAAISFPQPNQLCPPNQDSLVVMEVGGENAGRRRTVARGFSSIEVRAYSLSNAGSLVYLRAFWMESPQRYGVYFAPASGGAPREFASVLPSSFFPSELVSPDVLWQGETPHVLIASIVRGARGAVVEDVEGTSGSRTRVGSIPDALFLSAPIRRSADGATWAAWVAVEDLTPKEVERHAFRYRLYISTNGAPEPHSMLELSGYDPPWKLQIAPDGRHLAFIYQAGLYLMPID